MDIRVILNLPPDHQWHLRGAEEAGFQEEIHSRCPDGVPEDAWTNCPESVRDLVRTKQAGRSTLQRVLEVVRHESRPAHKTT
jgi:hypothetical protein